jgi:hypothetical protein
MGKNGLMDVLRQDRSFASLIAPCLPELGGEGKCDSAAACAWTPETFARNGLEGNLFSPCGQPPSVANCYTVPVLLMKTCAFHTGISHSN